MSDARTIHVADCPTPTKRGFLTLGAANAAMKQAVETELYTYMCRCGTYHLTRRTQVTDPNVDQDQIRRLLAMTDPEFDSQVSLDMRGRALPGVVSALRSAECIPRWYGCLVAKYEGYQALLSRSKGDRSLAARGVRSDLLRGQGAVLQRLKEVKELRSLRNKQAREARQERKRAAEAFHEPGRQRHKEASNRAISRLIREHPEEFEFYLGEALSEMAQGAQTCEENGP